MRNIKKIFTLVLSLILLFAIGCDTESKTGGKVTPPSEPETTEEGYFPPPEGKYKDDTLYSMYGERGYTKVSTITEKGIQKTKIQGNWRKDGVTPPAGQEQDFSIEKWKKTTKGGKTIKLEGELVSEWFGGKFTVTYDYETETLSGTFTKNNGEKYLFSGKKIE